MNSSVTPVMRFVTLFAAGVLLALGIYFPAWAQEASWDQLNAQAVALHRQGDLRQATQAARQALALAEKSLDPNINHLGTSLENLAHMYRLQNQVELAEPLARRAVTFWEDYLGPDHPYLAKPLALLGTVYRMKRQYGQTLPLFKRVVILQEKGLGPSDPQTLVSMEALASVHEVLGQYVLAESLYKRVLSLREENLGLEHVDVAISLYRLAEMYLTQSKPSQAEPLFKRAMAISDKRLGVDHPIATANLYGLVRVYLQLGQTSKANLLYDRVLANLIKLKAPIDPVMLPLMLHLAPQDMTSSQLTKAEQVFRRFLADQETQLGPEAPELLNNLINLADICRVQGKLDQAEQLLKRALLIEERMGLVDHPGMAMIWNLLTKVSSAQGHASRALDTARRVTAIHQHRILAGVTTDNIVAEAKWNQHGFASHLDLLARNPDQEPAERVANEAFQVVQLAQTSATAAAVAKMSSRFASGDDALAGLIRNKQDAADRITKAETQLRIAAGMKPQLRQVADEKRLRDDISILEEFVGWIDAELAQRFPSYQLLTRPLPLSLRQVQTRLQPQEAMLVYELAPSRSFVWVITPERTQFLPLNVNFKETEAQVAKVRSEMDLDANGRPKHVSLDTLHDLYQRLFAPIEPQLADIQHIMVVASGPLQSLPLAMLVTSPVPEVRQTPDYASVDWLTKRYALSALPAVSSLEALRRFPKKGDAQEPFAGFGDPVIGDRLNTTPGKRRGIDVQDIFRSTNVQAAGTAAALGAPDLADVEVIREKTGLPETADELRAMARSLKGGQQFLWLAERFTEAELKQLDLTKFRTLAFATHGVMAGEIPGAGEPGLILTPPRLGSLADDGYLSASEIAGLKLSADLVVLSACNTAAADGTPGAEGFSGLAKAFLYAGARSLLVSHWSVDSDATVQLTTALLREYQASPSHGKASAHRKAMLRLIHMSDYAHPMFWAPFVVVGEGGSWHRQVSDKS